MTHATPEARADMKRHKRFEKHSIAWQNDAPEWEGTNQLDGRIEHARNNMGEPRWAEVNRQWNDPNFIADRLDREQQS